MRKLHETTAPHLTLTGRQIGSRYEVMLDGKCVALRGTSFYYLFCLAVQAKTTAEGWIAGRHIEPGTNQARYLYRLKRELAHEGVDGQLQIENNNRGCYRLALTASAIVFDLDELRQFPDARVTERVGQLERSEHRSAERVTENVPASA